jgi:TolB-like protein
MDVKNTLPFGVAVPCWLVMLVNIALSAEPGAAHAQARVVVAEFEGENASRAREAVVIELEGHSFVVLANAEVSATASTMGADLATGPGRTAVARELTVASFIAGSVTRAGSKVRVQVNVYDGESGEQVATFERTMPRAAIQRQVKARLWKTVGPALSAAKAPPKPLPPPPVQPKSYDRDADLVDERPPQDEGPSARSIGLFINPLAILFGVYGVEFDYSPMQLLSLNVGLSYYASSADDVSTSAGQLSLGAQFFLTGEHAFGGFYLYPNLTFASASAEDDITKDTASAALVAVGATVGYQWAWTSGLALRLGLGALYYSVVSEDGSSNVTLGLSGVLPALDASIGWTF